MDDEHDTKELKRLQIRREVEELALAQSAQDEQEEAQHERRAEKARYLQSKLEEREESERQVES
jgi:hypothetical protein